MGRVKYSMKGVDGQREYKEPTPAVYRCKVVDLVDRSAKDKTKEDFKATFEVIEEGEFKGSRLYSYLQPEGASAWKFRGLLVDTLGFPEDGELTTDADGKVTKPKISGLELLIRVDPDSYKEQYRARVGMFIAADASDESDEDEGDDEGDESDEVDLDSMDRAALKAFIKEYELGIRVVSKMQDQDVRDAIAAKLEDEPEEEEPEEDDEPEEEKPSLDELDRTALKAFIKEHDLSVRVLKSMTDEDIRVLIDEAMQAAEPEEEPEGEDPSDEEDYTKWQLSDLKEEAKERGLPTAGSKAVVVARLVKSDAEESD